MSAVLDFNSRSTKDDAAAKAINGSIDAALVAKREKQERRTYLGASAIGYECERSIQFEYAGARREKDFPPATLRKFDAGHIGEELARCWFIDGGYELVQNNPRTRARYRWAQIDGKFSGEPDGVFLSGPPIPNGGYPCAWEHKFVGAKTYREVEKHGLKKARPGYYSQVQINAAYLQLTEHPTVFTVTNSDSLEQQHLLIPFDAEEAQRVTDKAVRIISATEAGDLLPRPFAGADHFVCKMCAFATRCWGLAA